MARRNLAEITGGKIGRGIERFGTGSGYAGSILACQQCPNVVSQCMPHDCGGQNAMVVIDTKHPRIWIGFHAHTGTGNSTRWFGTTDHHDVPASVLSRF